MKAGIISAGLGERLRNGGIMTPKPLVKVLGQPLIERTINEAIAAGAREVACIVNQVHGEVAQYLTQHKWPVPFHLVVKTTPSSMESFFQLEPFLKDAPFVLLTVDAVFPPGLLRGFLTRARSLENVDGVLAVTRFIDDEKPLRLLVNAYGRVREIGASVRKSTYITSGFYYFNPRVFSEMEEARGRNFSAFRMFLTHLVEKNYRIFAVEVGKTVDVDVPADIEKAEKFLRDLELG